MTADAVARTGRPGEAEIVGATRSGGRAQRTPRRSTRAYLGVDIPDCDVVGDDPTPDELVRAEAELASMIADVLERQRRVAA